MVYTLSQKNATHAKVRKAVVEGVLMRPTICSDCGKTGRIHAYHADYSQPLHVEWLCCKCHKKRHPIIHKHGGGRKALLRPCHISFDINKSLLADFRVAIIWRHVRHAGNKTAKVANAENTKPAKNPPKLCKFDSCSLAEAW